MQNFSRENLAVSRITHVIRLTDAATAANYTHFFVADRPYKVLGVSEIHAVAGNDGGAVTLDLEKLTGTTAVGSGTALLNGTINLKGTALTAQHKDVKAPTTLAKGDRLSMKLAGTPTAVSHVIVTVAIQEL